MKKKLSNFIILLCAALGLGLLVIPNGMRFTGWLLLWIAAAALVWRLLTFRAERSGAVKILRRLYAVGLSVLLTVLCALEVVIVSHGEADNTALPVDAVIVLGAGVNGETPSAALQSRIRTAASYLQSHPGIPVVLSGGQGPGEDITEAEAMRRALWTNSEEENARYLLEDRSTSTAENFRYSKALLEAHGIDPDTAVIAVVTNDFHCFRSHLIAKRAGLRTVDIPAELPWRWLTVNYYIRESFALVKTLLFD